jgi:hypothetical protein
MSFNKISFILLISIAVTPITISEAKGAPVRCSVVKQQVKSIIYKDYANTDNALQAFGVRIAKIYKVILENQNCLNGKEKAEIFTGLQEIKNSCLEAKKNELTYSIIGGLCKSVEPLYKYLKK